MAITTTHHKYGTDTSTAVKRRIASKTAARKGFAYPLVANLGETVTGGFLQKSSGQGQYFSTSTGTELIRNNLRQLLLCEKGERLMLPDYGLSMNRFVFEPLDQTTFQLIKNDIISTIKKYFSILNIITIDISSTEIEVDRHQLNVKLTLQIIDESLEVFDTEVIIN